jgi:hypothetical protein
MAGNVYKCDAEIGREVEVRESNVDGYATTLFFF